jgi:hypothetical protein
MPELTSTTGMHLGRGRPYDAGDPRLGGLPVWPPHAVPGHLHTRRQLAVRRMRAGGQPAHGLVLWAGPNGTRCSRLYDITQAKPRLSRPLRISGGRTATTQPG